MLVVCMFAAIVLLACAAAAGLIFTASGAPEVIERLPEALEAVEAAAVETKRAA